MFGILFAIFIVMFVVVSVSIAIGFWRTAQLSGKIFRGVEQALDQQLNEQRTSVTAAQKLKCQHCGSTVVQAAKCPSCGADMG